MSDPFEIEITRELEEFQRVFEANDRMIFSAPFGSGKSYFMDRFAKSCSRDYYFFTLYPVNYVISPTDSIMEYVKRDIVFQLVEQGLVFERLDVKAILTDMAKDLDLTELLSFLALIPAAQPVVKGFFKAGTGIKPFNSFANNYQSSSKYISSFSSSGTPYDNDAITCFIKKSFENLRKLDKRKIVLVIEDMDRIDPGHLFTILNIFGAHVDRHYVNPQAVEPNKFGFDKMVIIMDYNSVSGMFKHRYGDSANFAGYMGKFVTTSPYRYSIYNKALDLLLKKLLPLTGVTNTADRGIQGYLLEQLKNRDIRILKRIYEFDPYSIIRDVPEVVINGLKLAPSHLQVIQNAYTFKFDIQFYDDFSHHDIDAEEFEGVQFRIPYSILKRGKLFRTVVLAGNRYSIETWKDKDGRIVSFSFEPTKTITRPVLNLDYFEADYQFMDVFKAFEPYYYVK